MDSMKKSTKRFEYTNLPLTASYTNQSGIFIPSVGHSVVHFRPFSTTMVEIELRFTFEWHKFVHAIIITTTINSIPHPQLWFFSFSVLLKFYPNIKSKYKTRFLWSKMISRDQKSVRRFGSFIRHGWDSILMHKTRL